MSVSRVIKIRFLSNENCLSEFINKFATNEIKLKDKFGNFISISLNDEDYDYQNFEDIETFNYILNSRESENKINAFILWNRNYTESFGVLISKLENNFSDYKKHYLLSITPNSAKKIEGSERLTDFGFYLNIFIPKLISLECYICEVICHDYDI